ncbi:MAG: hypothetical protein AB8G17_03430 [Gammaproteobacteria bacterium]
MMRAVFSHYCPAGIDLVMGAMNAVFWGVLIFVIFYLDAERMNFDFILFLVCFCGPAVWVGRRYASFFNGPTAAIVPGLLRAHRRALCLLALPLLILPSLIVAGILGPAVGGAIWLFICLSFWSGVRLTWQYLPTYLVIPLLIDIERFTATVSQPALAIAGWSILWVAISVPFVWNALDFVQQRTLRLSPAVPHDHRTDAPDSFSLYEEVAISLAQGPLARAMRAGYRTRKLWQHAELLRFSLPGYGGEHVGALTMRCCLVLGAVGGVAPGLLPEDQSAIGLLAALGVSVLVCLWAGAGSGIPTDSHYWQSRALLLPGAGRATPALVTTLVFAGQLARRVFAVTAGLWCAAVLSDGVLTLMDAFFATLWLIQAVIASFAIALLGQTAPHRIKKISQIAPYVIIAITAWFATRRYWDDTHAVDRAIEYGMPLWAMLAASFVLLRFAYMRLQTNPRSCCMTQI